VKFALGEADAAEVERWAFEEMRPDPHADASGAYEVTTLYLDTPDFDVYHRARELGGAKYRVRRYGGAGPLFLEKKVRKGNRVRKQRVEVGNAANLPCVMPPSAAWFSDEVAALAMRPVCVLSYRRTAFISRDERRNFRLTLDRSIRGVASGDWRVTPVNGEGHPICAGRVVCEIKFEDALPDGFKRLVARLRLSPSRMSKYRRACAAGNLVRG
jgi:hypothetical protein